MPARGLNDGPALERLTVPECWQLLTRRTFGRLCFCVDDHVEVALTTFVVIDRRVFFRTTAYGPVARLSQSQVATLQVDDVVDDHRAGWSLTVTGRGHPVVDAPTLATLWTPVRPLLWDHGAEPIWMVLVVGDVQGRRVRRTSTGSAVSPGADPLSSP